MEVKICQYQKTSGWTPQSFPDWNSATTLVLVFGAPSYRHHLEPFQQLSAAFPDSHLIGCSTCGEILGSNVVDESLSVAIVRFANTELRTFTIPCLSGSGSYLSGRSIAQRAFATDLRGLFVLSDGITVNGSELVSGINSAVADSIVVTGGLAGDGTRFNETWVLKDAKPQSGSVTAVGFYGDSIQLHHGTKGGWDSYGSLMKITRSYGNRLYQLDGKPALSLYKECLGPQAAALPASALLFPLSIKETADSEKEIVRTILSIDEKDGAMVFAGDIPEGQLAQFMQANFDRLVDGASQAATLASGMNASLGDNTLSVAISCVGRRLVLKERITDELQATLHVLPKGTQQVGFYSYGEISPYTTGLCDLHNQTMTITTFSEQ